MEYDDDAQRGTDKGKYRGVCPIDLLSLCSAVISNYRLMLEGKLENISAEAMEEWMERNPKNWCL